MGTRCKDCKEEFRDNPPSAWRPAPHPGPRCATHWRAERKRRKESAHQNYVTKTYSLEAGDYAKLYELQGGVCAICKRATGASRNLSVDHDHACCDGPKSCGSCVRGLLCSPCNKMLGHGRDNPGFFYRASEYLMHPPARRLSEET